MKCTRSRYQEPDAGSEVINVPYYPNMMSTPTIDARNTSTFLGSCTDNRETPNSAQPTDKDSDLNIATIFKLPPDPQLSSRLLSLIPELRAMILRSLLKQVDPIGTLQTYRTSQASLTDSEEGETKILQGYKVYSSLSSHILRICQQLFYEAHHILYTENTICIEIGPHKLPYQSYADFTLRELDIFGSKNTSCDVLDVSTVLPDWADYIGMPNVSLEEFVVGKAQEARQLARAHRAPTYGRPPQEREKRLKGSLLFESRLSAIRNFKNLQINISCHGQKEMLISFRLLRDLLTGKQVTFVLPDLNEQRCRRLVSSQYLRCASCTWIYREKKGNTVQGGPKSSELGRSILAHHSSIITSQRIVQDTFDRLRVYQRTVLWKLKQDEFGRTFDQVYEKELEALEAAAMAYDVLHYEVVLAILLQMAVPWTEEAVQREKAKIEAAGVALKKSIDALTVRNFSAA